MFIANFVQKIWQKKIKTRKYILLIVTNILACRQTPRVFLTHSRLVFLKKTESLSTGYKHIGSFGVGFDMPQTLVQIKFKLTVILRRCLILVEIKMWIYMWLISQEIESILQNGKNISQTTFWDLFLCQISLLSPKYPRYKTPFSSFLLWTRSPFSASS